jgi:hypothetical protein
LINLGVFDVDPSSTQGAITIYENLQRYIPSIDGKPYTTIVCGDGLSCERGNDAHRGRTNGLKASERLEGCEPGIQEFHKVMLLLQDYFDEFFKGSSSVDRGTLCQLKIFSIIGKLSPIYRIISTMPGRVCLSSCNGIV